MKVVAISNPNFQGVTVATKAIAHEYIPVAHLEHGAHEVQALQAILGAKPDLLVVGGWSKGYLSLLRDLKLRRNFPVMSVYHGSLYHGAAFDDEDFWAQMELAYAGGFTDAMGFVQPQTADYYTLYRETPAVWVPHAFPPQPAVNRQDKFRIGIFGGGGILKNCYGAAQVANDFAKNRDNCSVVTPYGYNQPREQFLQSMRTCSVVLQTSHLECYSNTILEAWSNGVPVIMSPANSGLLNQYLLTGDELCNLVPSTFLSSGTDAVELYQAISRVHHCWLHNMEDIRCGAYEVYCALYARTCAYRTELFRRVCTGYRTGKYEFPRPAGFR